MRALLISAALLAAVLIYVFSSTVYLSGFFSELLESSFALPDSPGSAEDAVKELYGKWAAAKPAVIMLTDRSEADGIDAAFQRLIGAAEAEDEKEYTAAVAGLRYEIEQMLQFIAPSAGNVLSVI